jgi:hypothetical protein
MKVLKSNIKKKKINIKKLEVLKKNVNKKINLKNDKISSKEEFRNICNFYLRLIRQIKIPELKKMSNYETCYIEFRIFSHAEFLIRNTIIKLPQWAHTVVCGNVNYDSIYEICNKISPNITILKMNIDNLNTAEYSNLLLTKEFWKQFKGEKILLYQEDTFLFHNQI